MGKFLNFSNEKMGRGSATQNFKIMEALDEFQEIIVKHINTTM